MTPDKDPGPQVWGARGRRVSFEVRLRPDGSAMFATYETVGEQPIPVLDLTPAAVMDLIGFLLGKPGGSAN